MCYKINSETKRENTNEDKPINSRKNDERG